MQNTCLAALKGWTLVLFVIFPRAVLLVFVPLSSSVSILAFLKPGSPFSELSEKIGKAEEPTT